MSSQRKFIVDGDWHELYCQYCTSTDDLYSCSQTAEIACEDCLTGRKQEWSDIILMVDWEAKRVCFTDSWARYVRLPATNTEEREEEDD